jgi:hypothetical protein
MEQETDITRLLQRSRIIAVVGCSPKPERDSHRVSKYLQDAGFRVIPINPGANEILGVKAYPDLASIPPEIDIDIVDVFRAPEHIPAVVDAVLERGAKALWLQLGCANPGAEQRARNAGLEVVSDLCIKIEHRNRLDS